MSSKWFLNKWKADENAAQSTDDNEDIVDLNAVNNVNVNEENNVNVNQENNVNVSQDNNVDVNQENNVNVNQENNVDVNQENNIITSGDNSDSISDNAAGNNATGYQIEPVASSSKQNFYTPRTKRRMSEKVCTLMNKKALTKNTKEVHEPQLKNKLPNKNDNGASLDTRRKRKNKNRSTNLSRECTAESSTMNASYNLEFFSESSYISEFVGGSSPSDINASNLTHSNNESPGSLRLKLRRQDNNRNQSDLKNVCKQLNKDEFNNSLVNSSVVNTNAINKNDGKSTANSALDRNKPLGIITDAGSANQNTMLDSSNKVIGATVESETKNIKEDMEKNTSEYSSITNFRDRPCDINSISNVSNVDINKSMKDKNGDAASKTYESALIIDESNSVSGTIHHAVETEVCTKSVDNTNEQTDNNTFGSTNNFKKLVTTLTRRESKSENSSNASIFSTITYNHDADDGSNEPKNFMFQADTTVADPKPDPGPGFNESSTKSFNIHDRHFKFSTKNRTRNDKLVAVNATPSIKGNNSICEHTNEPSLDVLITKTYPEIVTVPDLITTNSSAKISPNRPLTNLVTNMSDANINAYNLNCWIKSKLLDFIGDQQSSSSGTIKKYPEMSLIPKLLRSVAMTNSSINKPFTEPGPSINDTNINKCNIDSSSKKPDKLVAINVASSINGRNTRGEHTNEPSIDVSNSKTFPEIFTVPDLITSNSSAKISSNKTPTDSVTNISDTNINVCVHNSTIKSKSLDFIDLDSNSSGSNIRCQQLDAKEASSSGTIKKYPEISLIPKLPKSNTMSSSINKPFTEPGPSINDTNINKCNNDSSSKKPDKLVAINVASSINGRNTRGEHTNEPSIDVSNSKTFPEIVTVPDLITSNNSAKISSNKTPTDSVTNISDTNINVCVHNSTIKSKSLDFIDLDSNSSGSNIRCQQLDAKEASSSGTIKKYPEISLIPKLPKSNTMSSSINKPFTEPGPSINDTNINKCNVDNSSKKPDKLVAINVASSINGRNTKGEPTNEPSIDVINSKTYPEIFRVPDLITSNSITKISTSRPITDSVTKISDTNINMYNPNTPIKNKSLDFIELNSSNTMTNSSINTPFNESGPSISDININKCNIDSSPTSNDKLVAVNVASSINGSNIDSSPTSNDKLVAVNVASSINGSYIRVEQMNEPIDIITETYPETSIISDLITSNSIPKISKTYTVLRNVSINDYDSLNSETIYSLDGLTPTNSTTDSEHLDININFSNSLTIIKKDNAEALVNSNIIDDFSSKTCISDPQHTTNSSLRITSVKSLAPLINLSNRSSFYQSDFQSLPTTNEEILLPVSSSSISPSEEFSSDQNSEISTFNANTTILCGIKRKKAIPNQPLRKSSRSCKKSVPDVFIVPTFSGIRKLSRSCTTKIPKTPKTPKALNTLQTPNKASPSKQSASPNKTSSSKQPAPPKKASYFTRRTSANKTSLHNRYSWSNMSSQHGRPGRPKKVCASDWSDQFNEAGPSNKSGQSSQIVDKGLRKRRKLSGESDKERKHSFRESFCYCGGGEVLPMIGCDNSDCERKWFHFICVGIKIAPKGKWFCRNCIDKEKRQNLKDKSLSNLKQTTKKS